MKKIKVFRESIACGHADVLPREALSASGHRHPPSWSWPQSWTTQMAPKGPVGMGLGSNSASAAS